MQMKLVVPQVLIHDTQLRDKKDRVVQEQVALLHISGKLAPIETRVRVDSNGPRAVGEYDVSAESFMPGKYGSVMFFPKFGELLTAAKLNITGKAA